MRAVGIPAAEQGVSGERDAKKWARQSLQLPPGVMNQFRDVAADQAGWGGVQVMGTAAIALLVGMPKDLRDAVCEYVAAKTWKGGDQVDVQEAWRVFIEAMRLQVDESLKTHPGEPSMEAVNAPRWFISRILDPEVTPPPGQKASDKTKARDRKSG